VGIRLRWSEDGTVSVSLNGSLAGSAEEACVSRQLRDLTVAPGSEGETVHALTAAAD